MPRIVRTAGTSAFALLAPCTSSSSGSQSTADATFEAGDASNGSPATQTDAYAGRDADEAGADASEVGDAASLLPTCDTDGGVTALVDNGLYVYQIAVDDSYVYLASFTGVYRVARTGGPLEFLTGPVASGGGQGEWVIAVDATRIYFSGDPGTFSVPLDGGTATPFNAPYANRIVVQGSIMYGGGDSVWSMPLDGGAATTLIAEGPAFIYGGFAPYGRQMFATSTVPGPAEVVMAAADGGAPIVLVADRTQPGPIAVDGTGIYWGEWSGGVYRAGLDGSDVTTLSADTPSSLAIDDVNVYWTSVRTADLMAVPKSGGAEITLASGLSTPNQLVGYAGNLYWCAQPEVDAGVGDEGGAGGEAPAAATVLTACK